MRLGKCNLIPLRQTAVEHLAHRLPPDLRQVYRLPVDGLEGVFQKAPGYRNPFLEPMMKGGMDQ